jgi:peptide/nickel transport system ATP-binding protein
VELARVDELFARPLHPYTKALLAAVPSLRPPEARRRNADPSPREGEVVDAPSFGCPFYPRCPSPAKDGECVAALPALEERRAGRWVRCVKA